jgi:hypothetical protein
MKIIKLPITQLTLVAAIFCSSLTSYAHNEISYIKLNTKSLNGSSLYRAGSSDGVVVKARAIIPFGTVNGSEPVTVTLNASTTGTFDNGGFVVPTMSNAVLQFGNLKFTALSDNDVDSCGATLDQHCGTALFRMYSIPEVGQTSPGFWNSVISYGAPITAGLPSTTYLPVGLNVAGAATLETYTIPSTQHVVSFSDFSPAPTFNIEGDFTAAGAGVYKTTLVLEYATTL